METMRLLFLLLTIWTTAVGSACAQQPHTDHPLWARSPPPPPPPPPPPTLDLTAPDNYPQFIENLRNIFSEKDQKGKEVLACSMKKISEKTPSPRYEYIDIKASDTVTVTLAIDRTNIYVIGYRDKINQNYRAFFFEDEYNNAKGVFPEVTVEGKRRYQLKYTGSYGSIGDKRDKVPLGFEEFKISIANIYGKEYGPTIFTTHQKTFFLIAIQMISEATRFKYISEKIPTYGSFTPDTKVKAVENAWGYLSTTVYTKTETSKDKPTGCKLKKQKENPKENVIVQLDVSPEPPWIFKSVEDIAKVVGLLKAQRGMLSINNDNNDNNDDMDGGVVIASS